MLVVDLYFDLLLLLLQSSLEPLVSLMLVAGYRWPWVTDFLVPGYLLPVYFLANCRAVSCSFYLFFSTVPELSSCPRCWSAVFPFPGRSFRLCSLRPWTITAMIIIVSTSYGTYCVSAVLSALHIFFFKALPRTDSRSGALGGTLPRFTPFSARCMFA